MAFSLACGSDGKGTGHNLGPDANKIGYDANFNLSARGGGTFHYDAEKRATRVTVPWDELVHNVYDGLGRCVLRKEWGVVRRYGYDGWKPFLEWDSWGTLVQWRLYGSGPDEILVAWTSTHGYLLYKLDRRGSVVGLLDLSDQIVENYTYDVFGTPIRISDQWGNNHGQRSWFGNRFMFTGREYFADMGIYDYRHRWYDAQLGRFLQPDPLGFAAGDNNLFRYCGGDPVNRVDPYGLLDGGASNTMLPEGFRPNTGEDPLGPVIMGTLGAVTLGPVIALATEPVWLPALVFAGTPTGQRLQQRALDVVNGITPGQASSPVRPVQWATTMVYNTVDVAARLSAVVSSGTREGGVTRMETGGAGVFDQVSLFNVGYNIQAVPGGWANYEVLGTRYSDYTPGSSERSGSDLSSGSFGGVVFDRYGSTTAAAANWEASWGNGSSFGVPGGGFRWKGQPLPKRKN